MQPSLTDASRKDDRFWGGAIGRVDQAIERHFGVAGPVAGLPDGVYRVVTGISVG